MTLFKHNFFLSHDWTTQNNHERVRKLKECLKKKGKNVWFDEDEFRNKTSNISELMCRGIDESVYIVIFITKKYMEKVASLNASDNCKKEFQYSEIKKTSDNMIPIVMEPELLDTGKWFGPVAMNLSGKLYIDYSEDDKLSSVVENLISRTSSMKRAKEQISIKMNTIRNIYNPRTNGNENLRQHVRYVQQQLGYNEDLKMFEIIEKAERTLGLEINKSLNMKQKIERIMKNLG